jgi:hypothetical protein
MVNTRFAVSIGVNPRRAHCRDSSPSAARDSPACDPASSTSPAPSSIPSSAPYTSVTWRVSSTSVSRPRSVRAEISTHRRRTSSSFDRRSALSRCLASAFTFTRPLPYADTRFESGRYRSARTGANADTSLLRDKFLAADRPARAATPLTPPATKPQPPAMQIITSGFAAPCLGSVTASTSRLAS